LKKPLAIVTLSVMLSACASLRQPSETEPAPTAADKAAANTKAKAPANARNKSLLKAKVQQTEDVLPGNELSEEILYKVLSSEIAFQRGQWQAAYVTLLSTAQQTRDPRLARRAAEIALSARRPHEALTAVRLWTELAPHSDEALQNYLGLIMLSENISEIQPLLSQRLADAAPQARGPMILQIQRLLARAKDKALALSILRDVVAPYSDLLESHLALAQATYANGDIATARKEADTALKIKPDSELAILTVAQVTQDPAEAMKLVGNFLKRYPDAREVRIAYARGLVEQKQYVDARNQFETLLKSDADDLTTLFALGILSVQTGKLQEAESYLKRYLAVLATQPEDEREPTQALLLLSQIAEERNDIDGALKWLEQVEPGEAYVNAQIRRGQLLARRGDIAGARKVLEQAQLEAGSEREQLQLIQGEAQILRDTNRHAEAAAVLQSGLKRFPDNTELLYDYAMAADKLGDYVPMEAALRKIMAINPANQHAYNALGYSLADRNIRLPEALTLIKKASEMAPDDAFITDSLGWIQFRLGNLDEAESQLRRAYGLRPDPEIGMHLGELLWVRGKKEEAKQLWRDAQSKDPGNEALKATLTRLNVQL